jgi:hypothetical protein
MSRSLLQTLNAFTSAAVRIVAIFTLIVAKMSHIPLIDWLLRPFCEGIVHLDGESAAEGLVCGIADAPKKLAAVPDERAPGKFKFRGAVRLAHFGDFHEIRSRKPV